MATTATDQDTVTKISLVL